MNFEELLWRNHFESNYDALLGSVPAAMASPGCDCAVLPVRNRREIFSSGNAGVSQCGPSMGEGLAKGGRSSCEKRISPEHEELNKVRSEGQLMSPFSSSGF